MGHKPSRLKRVGEELAKGYNKVPTALMYDRDLRPLTRLVAIHLWGQGDGFVNVGERAVARAVGVSSATVHKAYGELIESGWMKHHVFEDTNGIEFRHEYVIHQSRKIRLPGSVAEPSLERLDPWVQCSPREHI